MKPVPAAVQGTRLLLATLLIFLTLPASAQLLPNGSVNGGPLNGTTTSETFSFTASADGDGDFTVTPAPTLQAYIQFLDSDGASVRAQSSIPATGDQTTLTVPHINAGTTYFVRVVRHTGSGTFTLSSVYTPEPIANDTEPNNAPGTALSVSMPATRTGHLGYSTTNYTTVDGEDWYAFTVPQDGDLTVNLTNDSALQGYIQFFDSDGASLRLQSGIPATGSPTSLTIPHLNPGTTYFLRILRHTGYGGYSFTGTLTPIDQPNDHEPNNTADTARVVTMPALRTGHLGFSRTSYNDIDPEDWYRFTVPQDGDLTVNLTNSSGLQGYIQFYDSDKVSQRGQSGIPSPGNPTSLDIPHLNPGTTYFLRILRHTGHGSYRMTGSFVATSLSNDTEPNNAPGTALSVSMPATRTGHLGFSRTSYNDIDPEDWYAFTVPQDGDLTVNLTNDSTLQGYIQFFDSDGASMRLQSAIPSPGNPTSLDIPHLNPGTTYFLRILRNSGYGSYRMTGSFVATSLSNDNEPNNTPGSALSVSMPVNRTGHLGYSTTNYTTVDGEDWYAFTVPQDGDLTVNLTNDSALQGYIQFFDSDGASMRGQSGIPATGSPTSLTIPHLNPGTTYFLRIVRNSGHGSYRIIGTVSTVPFGNDNEPNNTPGSALSVSMPVNRTGHLGYSTTSYTVQDGEDWYAFTVPQDGDLTLTMTNTGALQGYIQFFDSDGASLRGQSGIPATGNPTSLDIAHLNPGTTYFLRIVRNGGHGGYLLEADFRPMYVVNDTELNDSPGTAIAVGSFDGVTGHLGYSRASYPSLDDFDWYAFSHPGGLIEISMENTATLQGYFQLFASDGGSLLNQSSVPATGGTASLSVNRAAGMYFLRVLRNSGYGGYGLNPQATVSLSGNITLEANLGGPKPVVIEVRPEMGAPMQFNVMSGSFSIANLPRQNYEVSIKGMKWLRRTEFVDAESGNADNINVTLLGGDADDSNLVELEDLSLLVLSFGLSNGEEGFDVRADFDCDDLISLDDLAVLVRNFGREGDE